MFQKTLVWLFCAIIMLDGAARAEDATLLAQANKKEQSPAAAAPANAEPTKEESSPPEAKSAITLDAAIQRALADSPRLKSYGSAMMASKGVDRQASALPNPEIGVEAENIGGQGPYKGTDSAEFTYGVSQLIEIGGKRSARQEVASKGYEIASIDYEAARMDLIRDVTTAYAEAVAMQEEVKLAKDQKQLAREVLESVSNRVAAAAEPLIQKSKAQVALATSEIAYNKATRDLEIARKKVASLWGQDGDGVILDSSDFFTIQPPAEIKDSSARMASTPDIVRLDAELARAKANLDLERANAVPDPTVSVGLREFRETSDQAFVVGVSLPIPVWNLNRGNIAKARHEVSKSESDKQAGALGLSTELTRATEELKTAYDEAEALKTTILPAAQKAFSLSRNGYQAGKLPYLEVLDAQRTLFEARRQRNAALKNYHIHRAEVERLTAVNSAKIQSNEDHNE